MAIIHFMWNPLLLLPSNFLGIFFQSVWSALYRISTYHQYLLEIFAKKFHFFWTLHSSFFHKLAKKRSRDHPAAPLCIRGYSICRGQTALTAFRKKLVKSKEWQSVWCQWSSWFRNWLFLTTCHNSGKIIILGFSDLYKVQKRFGDFFKSLWPSQNIWT